MGMDWHSSGITTSVIGALKRGLAPLSDELGIHVCGGRGRHSRQTPQELVAIGERVGFDGAALANASRLGKRGTFDVNVEFRATIRVTNPGSIQNYMVILTTDP